MNKYRYKKGRGTPVGLTADEVGAELERIADANEGRLVPDTVVRESRPKDAVLHNHFEWNDRVAAQEYRKVQARNIINVVDIVPPATGRSIPAFTSVVEIEVEKPGEAVRSYQRTVDLMEDRERRLAILQTAFRRLQALRRQYEHLAEFAAVWASLDRVEGEIAS